MPRALPAPPPAQLVFHEADTEVLEVFDPSIPTGIRKEPGKTTFTFLRYAGADVPEGYERATLEYLRRAPK